MSDHVETVSKIVSIHFDLTKIPEIILRLYIIKGKTTKLLICILLVIYFYQTNK